MFVAFPVPLWVAVIAAIGFTIYGLLKRSMNDAKMAHQVETARRQYIASTKVCPACAERILMAAKVCKFCGNTDLPVAYVPKSSAQRTQRQYVTANGYTRILSDFPS